MTDAARIRISAKRELAAMVWLRRRPAGGFAAGSEYKNRRRDAGATKP
jgi:hypothetical protein